MAVTITKKPEKQAPREQQGAHFVQKVIKGDTYLVLAASQTYPEDEFKGLYFDGQNQQNQLVEPPIPPKTLAHMVQENNVLAQCVEAMEVNIDGTGYELVPLESDEDVTSEEGGNTPAGAGSISADQRRMLSDPKYQGVRKASGGAGAVPPIPNPFSDPPAESKGDVPGPGQDGGEADPAEAEKPNPLDDPEFLAEKRRLDGFLKEPWPNTSLVSIRRKMRREKESCGYSALEVIRNIGDDVVGFRNLNGMNLRFVRLDSAVEVTKVLRRDGKDVELTYMDRERRYVQKFSNGKQLTYYRDFGSSRQLHRDTGVWETTDAPVPREKRATELLVFGCVPDVDTPYFLPRWVNQLPSVVGSRKGEEANLELFDAGGIPPAMIFVEGGTMVPAVAQDVRLYLSGQMKSRQRAVVVEVQSSSGAIDSAGAVRTRVERFGPTDNKDSMYANYDKSCEEHVRVGFRLPPLFVGRANDYNYASAVVSYMIAEAQVFQPEREEFDQRFNATIMKALGAKKCKFKSKPVTMKDVTAQIQALNLVKDSADPQSLLDEVNKIAGLTLEFKPGPDPKQEVAQQQDDQLRSHALAKDMVAHTAEVQAKFAPKPVQKMLKLAREFAAAEKMIPSKFDLPRSEVVRIRKAVDELGKDDRRVFDRFVGIHLEHAAA